MVRCTALALFFSLITVGPALAQGAPVEANQAALPMGSSAKGTVGEEAPAVYRVAAASSGVLVVTVASETPEVDIVIVVTDSDGQPLSDGRSDRDLNGDRGKEFAALLLPEAGTYLVHVELTSGEEATFNLSGAFAPAPELASPNRDTDGRPSRATAASVGKSIEDTLGGDDIWDWFVLQAEAPGTLTVLTKAPEGDLRLEAFTEGNYRQAIASSDQDLQDVKGNESVNIEVTAGQKIYVRVSTFFAGGDTVSYKLVSALIPE